MTFLGKFLAGIVTFILLLLLALMFTYRIPVGYAGVKFNKYGSDKGLDFQTVAPGWGWAGPNTQVFTFPTFTQTRTWDGKEAFSFGTVEGQNVTAEIGITYHVEADKVPLLFQTYRQGIDEITDVYLHNIVRDALVEVASKMPIEQVYGAGKSDLLAAVQKKVQTRVAPIGLIVDQISWVGQLGLPEAVNDAIANKIKATQLAQQRENEVATSKAEAQKVEAEAQGRANAQLAMAQAEAAGTLAKAQANAQAIELEGKALDNHPNVLKLRGIERWNGAQPNTVLASGYTPIIDTSK